MYLLSLSYYTFFTEIKLLCDRLNIYYDNIKKLILKNGWINPMHTNIPGSDGKLSFGGMCFPKDIRAFNERI
jgi:UDP-glucose 6-dehydrogenase